jgi:hypothetical protein
MSRGAGNSRRPETPANAECRTRNTAPIVIAALLFGAWVVLPACAQTQAESVAEAGRPVADVEEPVPLSWAFSASIYTYIVPDSREYVQPTFTADRDWLHLETRYNYEALETGSAWVGYNFGGGEKFAWEVTPMLGGVFGETTGIAPGYKGSLTWWKLELYSEGEYVIVPGESSDSFFYNWSELTLAPVDWFRFGLVTQRTRLYETDREIQRGLLVGFNYKRVNLTTYLFNLDDGPITVVVAAGVEF